MLLSCPVIYIFTFLTNIVNCFSKALLLVALLNVGISCLHKMSLSCSTFCFCFFSLDLTLDNWQCLNKMFFNSSSFQVQNGQVCMVKSFVPFLCKILQHYAQTCVSSKISYFQTACV